MVTVTCADLNCGVAFGIPDHVEQQARRNNERLVHCPNGHRFYYVDSEPEKLRKRITEIEASRDYWKEQAIKLEGSVRYWKGIAHRKNGGRQ